ncbi:MAG TPA: hypothetical protein PKE63_06390 [Lacibacter sp.]|nr:hypothetical protein [Lacibacter sp.]HMO90095.1 hypothetical protein [Lacibacter sp.]HMP86888.1 hypothetical protein [Lacibacter sp.]
MEGLENNSDELAESRQKQNDKRKWQIALRRYILNGHVATQYATYFGLDFKNLRLWIEMQFTGDLSWSNYGKEWQFDHIIPVAYFDFKNEDELKLCWNFTNIRVEANQKNKERGNRVDVLMAKTYFQEIYNETGYYVCKKLLDKIAALEISNIISTVAQRQFIKEHLNYLVHLEGFSNYEFELLNSGRNFKEVMKEAALIRNLGKE